MPTTSTPTWSAPHNGIVGDASATAGTAPVNQFLGTHSDQVIYEGSQILVPNGTGGSNWAYQTSTNDYDQPFTMSGTNIGRVQVPLLPVGNGADLLVSLWSDNGSGEPGSMIVQTRIPASWIYQFAAVSSAPAPSASAPVLQYTGNPLAVAQFNDWYMGAFISNSWAYPAASTGGVAASNPQSSYSGNYFIQCGGTNASSQLVADVFAVPYAGGTSISAAIPQPSMPLANAAGAAIAITNNPSDSSNTIVIAGGPSATATASAYTASLDPTTGTVSSWSAQASLPQALYLACGAAWNDFVYIVGGIANGGSPALSTIYYAQVQNGQITAWNTATLPLPLFATYAGVSNGFLFVMGGYYGSANSSLVLYAPLNPTTGAPGAWAQGPALPVASTSVSNDNCMPTPYGIILRTGNVIYSLGVSESGPAPFWSERRLNGEADTALFPVGAGVWQYVELFATTYQTAPFYLMPNISVPLPASGLTNGSTYHIMLQQQGGDLNDYLRMMSDYDVFPGDPTLLYSPRGAYSWQPRTSGYSIPLTIYNAAAPQSAMPAMPWHLWEDSGAKVTTLVSATTPDGRLLGVCEATRQAVALNSNTGFETGLAPWTCYGGTPDQSTAQVYTGQYACQVTPSGTASIVYLDSEQLACMPGQSVSVTAWMWFTAAVASNASLSVNWYELNGTYLSTSSNAVSVPAATWTEFTNTFTAPAGAYGFEITPALGGTPAASQVWYVDTSHAHYTYTGPQNATVTQVNWPGSWPDVGSPTGTTQLA